MKKGFTLIELLAVIVILALVALISVPLVLNIISKAEKGAFKDSAYGILKASELEYALQIAEGENISGTFVYNNLTSKFTNQSLSKEFSYKGTDFESGTIFIDGEKIAAGLYKNNKCALKGHNQSEVVVETLTEQECSDKINMIITKPIAVIDYTPNTDLSISSTITWSASNSTVVDGKTIVEEEWKNKKASYSVPGQYVVELRVKDNYDNWSEWTKVTLDIADEPLVFQTIGAAAYDGNSTTSVPVGTAGAFLTWSGSLANKVLTIDIAGSLYQTIYIAAVNSSNQQVGMINVDLGTSSNILSLYSNVRKTFNIIVPETATKVNFWAATSSYGSGSLYELSVADELVPDPVENLTLVPSGDKVALTWNNPVGVTGADIYLNGSFYKSIVGETVDVTPLYSNTNYTIGVKAVGTNNNRSLMISNDISTSDLEIDWRGLNAGVYDSSNTTYASIPGTGSVEATWIGNIDGKTLDIDLEAGLYNSSYLSFRDASNNVLPFTNVNTGTTVNNLAVGSGRQQFVVIAPAGAVKIVMSCATSSYADGKIYTIKDR